MKAMPSIQARTVVPRLQLFEKRRIVGDTEYDDPRFLIHLSKSDDVYFNARSLRQMGTPAAIRILWDPDSLWVGFQPTKQGDPNGYMLKQQGGKRSKSRWSGITAHALFKQIGLKVDKTMTVEAQRIGDVIAVDLSSLISAPDPGDGEPV